MYVRAVLLIPTTLICDCSVPFVPLRMGAIIGRGIQLHSLSSPSQFCWFYASRSSADGLAMLADLSTEFLWPSCENTMVDIVNEFIHRIVRLLVVQEERPYSQSVCLKFFSAVAQLSLFLSHRMYSWFSLHFMSFILSRSFEPRCPDCSTPFRLPFCRFIMSPAYIASLRTLPSFHL